MAKKFEEYRVVIKGKKMVLRVYPDANKSSRHARLFISGKPKFNRRVSAKKKRRKK